MASIPTTPPSRPMPTGTAKERMIRLRSSCTAHTARPPSRKSAPMHACASTDTPAATISFARYRHSISTGAVMKRFQL